MRLAPFLLTSDLHRPFLTKNIIVIKAIINSENGLSFLGWKVKKRQSNTAKYVYVQNTCMFKNSHRVNFKPYRKSESPGFDNLPQCLQVVVMFFGPDNLWQLQRIAFRYRTNNSHESRKHEASSPCVRSEV